MESFFSLLQKNVLDRRRWNSRDELALIRDAGVALGVAGCGTAPTSRG